MPNAWDYWVTNCQITTSGSTNSAVWNAWVGVPTTTSANVEVWNCWVTTSASSYGGTAYAPPAPSEREQLILANRRRSHELRRRVAQRTAERLLVEHLDDGQRREWEEGKAFHVETADGRRRYRIALGLAGNVRLVRDGDAEVERRYCMHVYHPDGPVPNEDNVLAQKLLIEANEDEFLRHANVC